MQYPVYRNLDKPFQILGFSVLEIAVLCILIVGGGELAELASINRIWALLLSIALGFSFYSIRRFLGENFIHRFLRFLLLPHRLNSKLLEQRRGIENDISKRPIQE